MIITALDPRHGRCSLTIDSAEDLWALRRLIAKGDVVVTRSSRVVKREEEYSRPDKGERVKLTIALSVSEVHLDSSIERIRLKGTIVEASDESVTKSGSHAVTLSPGQSVTIRKQRWTPLDTRIVKPPQSASPRFVLVAADRREAGVGTLSGSHLSVVATIESGLGGKMSGEQDPGPYLSKVVGVLSQSTRPGDEIVITGPGNFKNSVANLVRGRVKSVPVRMLEGADVTGSDGVRSMVRSPAFRELAKGTVLVTMQGLVDEFVRRVSLGDQRVAYGLARVKEAADAGVVESCVVSDDVFSAVTDEDALVEVLNTIESKRGAVYLADSSVDFGKQVSSFSGIVALLRYPFRASR